MKNNKIQFICFPYAGGGASVFYSWKQQLMDVADVLAIQYPGHESRFSEKPFTNMEELVRLIYKEIGHGIEDMFGCYINVLEKLSVADNWDKQFVMLPSHQLKIRKTSFEHTKTLFTLSGRLRS